jgi:hypothetical protein
MTSSTESNTNPSPDHAVAKAVADAPGLTTRHIAQAAGIARSTAGKVLGRLADNTEVTRHKGGRDGNKRLPDRFTLPGVEMPTAYAAQVISGSTAVPANGKQPGAVSDPEGGATDAKESGGSQGSAAANAKADRRLKAGGLEPLVLKYLNENADSGPHGPTTVGKALDRSSGAIGNCLVRLTAAKKVRQVSEKPRRYSLAA